MGGLAIFVSEFFFFSAKICQVLISSGIRHDDALNFSNLKEVLYNYTVTLRFL